MSWRHHNLEIKPPSSRASGVVDTIANTTSGRVIYPILYPNWTSPCSHSSTRNPKNLAFWTNWKHWVLWCHTEFRLIKTPESKETTAYKVASCFCFATSLIQANHDIHKILASIISVLGLRFSTSDITVSFSDIKQATTEQPNLWSFDPKTAQIHSSLYEQQSTEKYANMGRIFVHHWSEHWESLATTVCEGWNYW